MSSPTYDRPVKATLHVHLSNGEQWEATPDDFDKFNLITRLDAYMAFNTALTDVLTSHGLINHSDPAAADGCRELTDSELNPLRYLVESVLCYPNLLDHPEHNEWLSVANLERALRTDQARALTATQDED